MSYRNDLDALEARHAALEADVAAKAKERDISSRLLDEAKARARLPILDNIRVATPCSADWSQMTGDDRVRACGACNKHVYNLSSMTRDEAEALLIEREGSLCVRYFQRADGTIMLADCAIGKAQKRKRRIVAAGAAALLAGGGLVAFARSRSTESHSLRQIIGDPEPRYVMGGAEAPPQAVQVMGAAPVPKEVKGNLVPEPTMGKLSRKSSR